VADIIQLLSDHIANQIAAGEVIQRPASAVKELLENAIDAGATEIQLVLKDAGKELIQVIDNGKGMSPTDARMSFERHATSKIKNIDDLFRIRTMGFRGEALASIAAVAQVEMKTRQATNEVGSKIVIEGTEVVLQEPCAVPVGTNIMVKNLFFNVPARRNFLKSNNTEFRNILDEFTRVALAYPAIAFKLWHNGVEQFRLESGNLKTRIVGLLPSSVEKNLVPVEETTEWVKIHGFIGKPESSTKTRGNQFFFINDRFIRNAYLHHAVTTAYEGLIEKETFPFYVLFLETDPARVDVNVHPTKQEVKFEDDRMMYAYLNAAVKHALARFNIAPSLDFTLNPTITHLPSVEIPISHQEKERVETGYLFNNFSRKDAAHFIDKNEGLKQWKELYQIAQQPINSHTTPEPIALHQTQETTAGKSMLVLQNSFLVTTVKSGLMVVHIRRAFERIWQERLLENWDSGQFVSQQLLFPATYEWSSQDCLLLTSVLEDLVRIGFDIAPFGQNTFVVRGVPPSLVSGDEKEVIDEVLEHLRHESNNALEQRREQLTAQIAKRIALNKPQLQQPEEQQALIDELFACAQPEYAPDGKKVFSFLKTEALQDLLG
jgi:DNA mismatch repair protein MutL